MNDIRRTMNEICGDFVHVIRSSEKICLPQIFGDVAQLGERLNGIQEVEGSIPFVSIRAGLAKPSPAL